MLLRLFFSLTFIVTFFSCTSTLVKGTNVYKPLTSFGVDFKSHKNWKQGSFLGADLFFRHKEKNAQIIINSHCKNFSDSPLEALTAQLLVGFTDIEYLSKSYVDVAERGALVSRITAKLDGVNRHLVTFVLRKNRCVYDAILSMERDEPQLLKEFSEIIKTFWARS